MSSRLPIEIVRRIVASFLPMYDCSNLASLALLSREVQPLAERQLYLALYLYGPRAIEMILNSFTSRPVLASYVKQLFIQTEDLTITEYWTHIEDAFQRTSSTLQKVTIISSSSGAPHASWVLRGLHNGNGTLTYLRIPFNYDRHVKAFLESAASRSLIRIELVDMPILAQNYIPGPVSLHPDAANSLQIVIAPPAALCAIVPGRPVTNVHIALPFDQHGWVDLPTTEFFLSKLSQGTAPKGIVYLDLGELSASLRHESYSLDVLDLVPHYLPNITWIGLINYPTFPGNNINVRIYHNGGCIPS